MSVKEREIGKYVVVPPDGGWGYMIGLGVILNFGTMMAFFNCFGMLFKDLFIEINMDSTTITVFIGVSASAIAIAGFIAAPLQKLMSLRQLGLIAALVFNLGTFCTIFVKSKFSFILTQGIIQGFGNGLIYNLSFTVLNNYFLKRRLLAFSVTQTVSAAFCLISPHFVKWSIEMYGSQGTLLLVSAISLHNIFGMALMQPVKWHMKKVEKCELEGIEIKLLNENKPESEKITYKFHENVDKNKNIRSYISQFIDFSLFKQFVLTNACIALAVSGFLEMTFVVFLPQFLYSMGWNESDVAKGLSLMALGDILTRIAIIIMSSVINKIGSHETYVAGLIIAFVSRIGMLWTENTTVILTFLTIMGISRCTITVLVPVVVSDSVDNQKFSSAIGMLLILYGIINSVAGPVIGAIRDLTDSYSIAFYVITLCFGILVISWTIELLYKKSRNKKTIDIVYP